MPLLWCILSTCLNSANKQWPPISYCILCIVNIRINPLQCIMGLSKNWIPILYFISLLSIKNMFHLIAHFSFCYFSRQTSIFAKSLTFFLIYEQSLCGSDDSTNPIFWSLPTFATFIHKTNLLHTHMPLIAWLMVQGIRVRTSRSIYCQHSTHNWA